MEGVIIALLGGLILGSFLNVVIYRFDDWLSIATTRSRCRDCGTQLRWYDLIPVISFITLKGRCRYCHKPISWQYPVVELSMAFLLAAGYAVIFGSADFTVLRASLIFTFYILSVSSLIVIFFHDLYEMYISDYMSYFFILSALGFAMCLYHNWQLILMGAFIMVLPIALIVYPSKGKLMGEGDVKLALGLGILAGYPGAIVAIVSAFILGGAYGAVALLARRAKMRSEVPFAPFLILGTLVALFFGMYLINWYLGVMGFQWYINY